MLKLVVSTDTKAIAVLVACLILTGCTELLKPVGAPPPSNGDVTLLANASVPASNVSSPGIPAAQDTEPVQNATQRIYRPDGAYPVIVDVSGSLQNPAWSPTGTQLLFTRFRKGYNAEPADLFITGLENWSVRLLVSDGSGNVNLPGSSWHAATGKIVFSSSREPHDEIYITSGNSSPGEEAMITSRDDMVAYEPSLSPDGQWVVFESHELDMEGNGVITKYKADGTAGYEALTSSAEDSRQPNWSPAGELIVYQKFSGGQWDVWVMDTNGGNKRRVTSGDGDKTDASFSPDGKRIVYSSDEGGSEFANLFIIPVSGGNPIRVTDYDGYDGAPSWSPDGRSIAFESYPGDPDDSEGTSLWIINVSK
jgi:TolB protein